MMAGIRFFKLSLIFSYGVYHILGDVNMTCNNLNPSASSSVTCMCDSPGGQITWRVNGGHVANCFESGNFCNPPMPSGYTLAFSGTTYVMTINSFTYESCATLTCLDSDNHSLNMSAERVVEKGFNNVPIIQTEPSGTSGEISITTDCVVDYSNIVYKWYTIKTDGEVESYNPETSIYKTTLCEECNGVSSFSVQIGMNHVEPQTKTDDVEFRVIVYHKTNPSLVMNVTFTKKYGIYDTSLTTSSTVINNTDNMFKTISTKYINGFSNSTEQHTIKGENNATNWLETTTALREEYNKSEHIALYIGLGAFLCIACLGIGVYVIVYLKNKRKIPPKMPDANIHELTM